MFELSDLLAPAAPGAPQTALGGFVLGSVTENNNKEHAGMVKVEYTAWLQGQNITDWLPVLQPYAGAEHGAYLLPEIGDVVLVGFIGRTVESPFVLGSFHPANAKLPGQLFHKDNARKQFKTKGGITLDVLDEDGKQQATLTTPKGLRVTVEDEKESITLTDKDAKNAVTIDCKNGKMALVADAELTLTSGRCTLKLDGKGGEASLKCNKLNVEATQTGKLAAKAMMTVEGATLTLEGKQQAALKGGAMTEISGGMVKIN